MLTERVSIISQILLNHNPMQLESLGPNEYEPEALSIVARLAEACIDKQSQDAQKRISALIVNQAFEFWFGKSFSEPYLTEFATMILVAYLEFEQFVDQKV